MDRLPEAVETGAEPFFVIGAAGGCVDDSLSNRWSTYAQGSGVRRQVLDRLGFGVLERV